MQASDPLSNSTLAMFVSHNKPSSGFNCNQGYKRGRDKNTFPRGRGGISSNFTPSHLQQQPQSTPQGKFERPTC